MNEISIIMDYVIELFNSNNLVNTISTVDDEMIDANKENIYPVVNLDLQYSIIENDVIVVSLKITVVQQRDQRPVILSSKLMTDTNFIDNINETHSICQKFINYLTRKNNNKNIEIRSISNVDFLKEWRQNKLDGCVFVILLTIPNIASAC
jgi:hypothetical protein